MHEEGGQIEFDDITFGALAKDCNEEIGFVKQVISDCISEFKLFRKENDIVISGRVSRNLEWKQELSKSRSNAGKLGANARQNQAKKERKKENSGIEFSADGLGVIFQDGSFQEFGQSQLLRFKHGDIKPDEITKGVKI